MANNNIFEKNLEIVKTLNSKPRLQSILLLFIYRRLSLEELSSLLGKTKNTVIYHMKLLGQQGLIEESDLKVANSIKPLKIYSISPDFTEKLYIPFDKGGQMPAEKIMEYSRSIFRWNILLFETMREFFKHITDFYAESELAIQRDKSALDFHANFSIPRDLIPLSEPAFEKYSVLYQGFLTNVLEIINAEEDEISAEERVIQTVSQAADDQIKSALVRPYLAFNTVIPIKTLVEKKYRRRTREPPPKQLPPK